MSWTLSAALLGGFILSLAATSAVAGVESSYHGQLGLGTGLGMLEKWCALPNFSFEQQGGISAWTQKDCNTCHIGADWNPTRPAAVCADYCHGTATGRPTVASCVTPCHAKDTAKRGDVFTAAADVHIAAGLVCQDCHRRETDTRGVSDHQFLKGTALDTTEPTMAGTLSCTSECHSALPHTAGTDRAATLNDHTSKVACETCHTGLRPGMALESRKWNVFTAAGKPLTVKRAAGWLPEHKWYDNKGPGSSGDYHLPILGYTERRLAAGAKIYPFNPVSVDWFVKKKNSDFDDVIIVPEVKAADADNDRTVTVEEMRVYYRKATLVTAEMNFSISHSVVPAGAAFECNDCHGKRGWVLDWKQLGYKKDPRTSGGK